MEFRVSSQALVQRVGDEAVILDLLSGTYFGLDVIGARVWEALAAGRALDELIDEFVDEYATSRETLKADIDELIQALLAHRLLAAE